MVWLWRELVYGVLRTHNMIQIVSINNMCGLINKSTLNFLCGYTKSTICFFGGYIKSTFCFL